MRHGIGGIRMPVSSPDQPYEHRLHDVVGLGHHNKQRNVSPAKLYQKKAKSEDFQGQRSSEHNQQS